MEDYIITVALTHHFQDESDPPLSSSLNVSVRVDPVPPTFDQLVYEAYTTEFTNKVSSFSMNVVNT